MPMYQLKKIQMILSRNCEHYTALHTTNTHRLTLWESVHLIATSVNWRMKIVGCGFPCSTDCLLNAGPTTLTSGPICATIEPFSTFLKMSIK